jgi:hypothetical protein
VLPVLPDLRVPHALAAAMGYRGQLGVFALDMNLWPPQISPLRAAYDLAGRGAMILTRLTLDMLLPFAYAVLLADPARLGGARYDSLASANDGILAWALVTGPADLGRPMADVWPASLEPIVRSYCLATDPVCDPSRATASSSPTSRVSPPAGAPWCSRNPVSPSRAL